MPDTPALVEGSGDAGLTTSERRRAIQHRSYLCSNSSFQSATHTEKEWKSSRPKDRVKLNRGKLFANVGYQATVVTPRAGQPIKATTKAMSAGDRLLKQEQDLLTSSKSGVNKHPPDDNVTPRAADTITVQSERNKKPVEQLNAAQANRKMKLLSRGAEILRRRQPPPKVIVFDDTHLNDTTFNDSTLSTTIAPTTTAGIAKSESQSIIRHAPYKWAAGSTSAKVRGVEPSDIKADDTMLRGILHEMRSETTETVGEGKQGYNEEDVVVNEVTDNIAQTTTVTNNNGGGKRVASKFTQNITINHDITLPRITSQNTVMPKVKVTGKPTVPSKAYPETIDLLPETADISYDSLPQTLDIKDDSSLETSNNKYDSLPETADPNNKDQSLPETTDIKVESLPETYSNKDESLPQIIDIKHEPLPQTIDIKDNSLPETLDIKYDSLPQTSDTKDDSLPETIDNNDSLKIYDIQNKFIPENKSIDIESSSDLPSPVVSRVIPMPSKESVSDSADKDIYCAQFNRNKVIEVIDEG